MSFLVDTDIYSAYLRGNAPITAKFVQHGGRLGISVITAAELLAWARRSKAPASRQKDVADLLQIVQVIDVNLTVADLVGSIRAQQLDSGSQTPRLDLLIAATALAHQLTLVTHNVKDFASIPGLMVVDWLTP